MIPLISLFFSSLIHAQIGNPTNSSNGNISGFPNQYCFVGENPDNSYLNTDISDYKGGVLEVAVDVDYQMYLNFNKDVNLIENWIDNYFYNVNELYSTNLSLTIDVVYTHIWTTPDPFYGSYAVDVVESFKEYWNVNNDCIHRDVVVLLTNKLLDKDGVTPLQGNICTDYQFSNAYCLCSTYTLGHWLTIAHELGHCLGSDHAENYSCTTCNNSVNCELMCKAKNCSNSNPAPNDIVICEEVRNVMKAFITYTQKKCYNCIDSITQLPTVSSCPGSCKEYVAMSIDKYRLDNTCQSNDTLNITLDVFGKCNDTLSAGLVLSFNTNYLKIVDFDGFTFNSSNNKYEKSVIVNNGEKLSFKLKGVPLKTNSDFRLTFSSYFSTCTVSEIYTDHIEFDVRTLNGTLPGGKLSDLIKNGLFPDNVQSNGNSQLKIYKVNGDIEIDTFTILNLYEWVMGEGTRITVNPNNLFLTRGCTFRSCDQMWKGILVEDGAKYYTSNDYYSITRNKIKDAEFGVTALPGSTIDIYNTDFINNYIGFLAAFLDVDLDNFNVIRFSNNIFSGTGKLKNKYNGQTTTPNIWPYCGVQLINIPYLNIRQSTFNDMANGIVSNNSSMMLNGCSLYRLNKNYYNIFGNGIYANGKYNRIYADSTTKFKNMTFGILANGMQFLTKKMIFDNVNTGISATLLDKSIFEVEQSTFTNINYCGIYGFRYGKVKSKIKDNTITIKYPYGDNNSDKAGILLFSRTNTQGGWLVKNNTINVNNATVGIGLGLGYLDSLIDNKIYVANGLPRYRGIYAYGANNAFIEKNKVKSNIQTLNLENVGYFSSGLNNSRLICNLAENLGKGIEMNAVNNFTFLTTNILNKDGQKALYYERGTIIGAQILQGNDWQNASEAYNNSIDFANSATPTINNILTIQQYQTNGHSPAWWYPFPGIDLPNDVTVDWFMGVGDVEASCTNPPTVANPSATEEYEKKRQATEIIGINGSNGHPLWNENTKWTAQSRLFDLLHETPNAFGYDEGLNSFMMAANANELGAYANIRRWANAPPTVSEAAFNNNQANTDATIQSLQQLDAQQLSLSEPDTSLIQQQRAELQNLANLNAQLSNQMATAQSQVHSEGVGKLSQNSGLVASNTAQQNEKELNGVVLTQITTNNPSLDSSQLMTVVNIAAQCPISGGDAVYRARTIVATLFPTVVYNDAVICGTSVAIPRNENVKITEDLDELIIVPNPSQGKFEVKNLYIQEPTHLQIYSLTGHLIYDKMIHSNTTNVMIDDYNLDSGVYIIYQKLNDKNLKFSKLVIVK